MKRICLLLFFVGVGFGSGTHTGKHIPGTKNEHRRVGIINGKKTSITKYPFMASLRLDGVLTGSGVVLNKHWILTTGFNVNWYNKTELEFRVGSNRYDRGGQVRKLARVVVNENYTGSWDYDIAVVRVNKPMKLGKKVKKAVLGKKSLKGGTKTVIAGWGEQKYMSNNSATLLSAKVTVLDNKSCSQTYPSDISPRTMCTYDKTVGPCEGDSSDPLIIGRKIYGLYAGAYDCEPGNAQVYVNVPSLHKWVENAIKYGDQVQPLSQQLLYY